MKKSMRKVGRRCEDCGREIPVRVITFWASGMRYTVCKDCERPYRHIINWPVRDNYAV